MAERWDRLVAAVGEAASMPAADASAYLRDTLADDADLLREAQAILDGGLDPDDFLSDGAGRASPAPELAEGATFGAFRVRRLLGRGGMGAVFLADQRTPQRAVALKILESTLLSEKARARFEYEVQALASLRHRGIAQIYETGVQRLDDGLLQRDVPWFAMEYVEDARTLLDYAAAQRLATNDRLKLLLEVCDAVHHGHQKGVVHRDLKPDNILVGSSGHPKVIDFGVARGVASESALTQHTGPAEIIGTLPYLSPERVTSGRGDADVRADVYALGVVLYQLLTGHLPIEVDGADIVTSARRICEDAPPKPSSRNTSLPRDLDAIVLKALAKDPGMRYASVDAVADDLRRFLEHRPVGARVPGVWHQLRLFARRHRALVVSAAAILVVGVAATVVSVNWALESEQSEQRATKEKAAAVEQRSRAEQLFETVFKRSVEATLREAPKLHVMPGGPERVKPMMDAVLEDLGVLESMAQGDPRVQVLIAETWIRIGDTQGNLVFANLGDPEAAEASYRRALTICTAVLESREDYRDARLAATRARIRLATILDQAERRLRMRRQEDPALRTERKAILQQALVDARALHEEDREDDRAVADLVDAHVRLARLALDEREFEVMREHAGVLAALFDAGHLDTPLKGQEMRAWSYHGAEDWDAAREAWAAVAVTSKRVAGGPEATYESRVEYARHLGLHGESAFLAGKRLEAVGIFEDAVRSFEKLVEQSPKDRRVAIQLYIQLTELARAYGAQAIEQREQRTEWLLKKRGALEKALGTLGPAENDQGHRAGMRAQLQAQIEQVDTALGP